jgi:hypothetical protein
MFKENYLDPHYKDHSVNEVLINNCDLILESYETRKYVL